MERPTARTLSDGRLHLSHGPIDLLVSADGEEAACEAAFAASRARFATVLEELAGELAALRRPAGALDVHGRVARRMAGAVAPHRANHFVTPMAAVAGAVADEILAVMTGAAALSRAIVNNGGDIALHLAPGERATARIALADGRTAGTVRLCAGGGVGGLATSGRHGRSLSLGIADSVTVLAGTAAAADAAATLLANAVDLPGHPGVTRVPAETLEPDSDLAGRFVTTRCAPLGAGDVAAALDAGAAAARAMLAERQILAAALFLQGNWRTVGAPLASLGGPNERSEP